MPTKTLGGMTIGMISDSNGLVETVQSKQNLVPIKVNGRRQVKSQGILRYPRIQFSSKVIGWRTVGQIAASRFIVRRYGPCRWSFKSETSERKRQAARLVNP